MRNSIMLAGTLLALATGAAMAQSSYTTPTYGGGSRTQYSDGTSTYTTPTYGGGYQTTDPNDGY